MKKEWMKKVTSTMLAFAMIMVSVMTMPMLAKAQDYDEYEVPGTLYPGDGIFFYDEDDEAVYVGDIYVTYYDADGSFKSSDYSEGYIDICGFTDNSTGKTYTSYTRTAYDVDYDSGYCRVDLRGNRPAPDKKTYNIYASHNEHGSITSAGDSTITEGNSKTYEMKADNGYQIERVVVDNTDRGVISSYTFSNVHENHNISVYFTPAAPSYPLTVAGSYSTKSGAGSYQAGKQVTLDPGVCNGFVFAGWTGSDGRIFKAAQTQLTMPQGAYAVTASWIPVAMAYSATTTNLKGTQATNWTDIASKLLTMTNKDLTDQSNCLKVTETGVGCLVDSTTIAALNTKTGFMLNVAYGTDISYTFYSDLDNSKFIGSDLTCVTSYKVTGVSKEKDIDFSQPGAIGTPVNMNVRLDNAIPGQTAYVYIGTSQTGRQNLYCPVVVDANGYVTVTIIAKTSMSIIY